MSTNRPNASIWDDDEGEAQLRPMMRKNNAHLFDDEPPASSLSAASAASAAAAVAGYTASSAAEANAASALSAPSAYSVGSASSALSARSAGSAHSAVSASSAAVPSAASAAAPEAAGAAVSAPTPDSAGSAPLSARSGATPDAAPNAASAQSGATSAASAPAMPPSQAPKSAPSAPVNGPVLGTTPSVHVPASSLANNGVPAMLANTPPATGRRYTNAENAHTSGTFDSAARRATATTAATSATASTGASALTAASAAAASVTAQSPVSAASANAPELADAVKPAVSDAGAANAGAANSATANSAAQGASAASASEPASAAPAGAASNPPASAAAPRSGAVRRRSLFTAVPQPVPVDEDGDDETIQVPVVREDLIPDSFSAASAVSASAASASATSAAESASAAETVSAAETTSAAETSSSVSAASAPSSLEHSSAAASPASASDDVAPESAAQESTAQADQADQADQEAVDSVQELNDAYEVEAAAVPLPTDFDAPSAISIPTPPHTVSSALSAESTFSIDSAVSAASAASSVGITLPSAATPAPAVPVTLAPAVPVTPAAGATDTASNELSKTTPTADAPEPPAPPAPEQPEATSVEADFADDEVVASDHTETTIMDAADMELEEVVKPVVTSTSPVGVERLDHLATADSADLAPVAPSPSSAIFASTRTAAFSDSANQSDADNEVDDDVLLAGSTVVGKPASRAAAHWGGTLLALVLFPIAWFLMHTAANALTGALADGWPKVFSTAGIIELGMAIVLLIVVMATATRSSLGTFVTGITTLLIGLPFVVVPSITKQYLGDFLANMALQSRFGRILSEAILLDGVSGRLVIIGLFLIMLGVVSHSTRRAGRRERLVMDRANTKK